MCFEAPIGLIRCIFFTDVFCKTKHVQVYLLQKPFVADYPTTNQEIDMKTLASIFVLLLVPTFLFGTTRIVDRNHPVGGVYYNGIADAILASASSGDTIVVFPGFYDGAFTVSKAIVIMGSGYETTIISSNSGTTITLNNANAKVMWFDITSNAGVGVTLNQGLLTNCLIRGCATYGVQIPTSSSGIVMNCCVLQNGSYGIHGAAGTSGASVVNTISYFNGSTGFFVDCCATGFLINYCDGSTGGYVWVGAGNKNCDPLFTNLNSHPADLHVSTACAADAGKPDLYDPDGSRSDMGYFGGTDCPVFPIVKVMNMSVNGSTVTIDVTGKANY